MDLSAFLSTFLWLFLSAFAKIPGCSRDLRYSSERNLAVSSGYVGDTFFIFRRSCQIITVSGVSAVNSEKLCRLLMISH